VNISEDANFLPRKGKVFFAKVMIFGYRKFKRKSILHECLKACQWNVWI